MVQRGHGSLRAICLLLIASQVVVRVGAPPALNTGQIIAALPHTESFEVNIGVALSKSTDTSLAFPTEYLTRTWRMLESWINTENRTDEVLDYQCNIAATEHWLRHCVALPKVQCGTPLLPHIQHPTEDACWEACDSAGEDVCRAMEYDRLEHGCYALPSDVFRECLPEPNFDRVIRWRRPIFATPTLQRIYVNITIWDDYGDLDMSREAYDSMLNSGHYDAYFGPASPEFDPIIAAAVSSHDKLLITHASNPLNDDPIRRLLNESHMPGGRRDHIALILVFFCNHTTGVRFDAPSPLEEGMTENILETFQDAIASQFNFIPQALTVHSLSVTVTGEWKGDDGLPNYEYKVVLAVEARKNQLIFLLNNGVFAGLCDHNIEPIFGYDTESPYYNPHERCQGPFDFRPQSFTVRARAKYYFQDSITMLYFMGARSVIFTSMGNAHHDALCFKGYEFVLEQGLPDVSAYYVKLNSSFVAETELVLFAMQENIDGFVGCGDLEQMVSLTWMLKSWNYNPKALVLLDAHNADFHYAVGQGSAVQMLSPIAGQLTSTAQSPIFAGTDETVFTLWDRTQGDEAPTEHVPIGEAALAGIMRAFELTSAKNATIASLQAAMLAQSWDNGLGAIRWDLDGTLFYNWLYTAQMKPRELTGLDDHRERCLRYLNLEVEVLSTESGTFSDFEYPLLTWIEREASLYPCEAGSLLNMSAFDFSLAEHFDLHGPCDYRCDPCPRGRSANAVSMRCNLCNIGFYAAEEGQSACSACHDKAMECDEEGMEHVPYPTKGWYRFKERPDSDIDVEAYLSTSHGGYLFVKCDPEQNCLPHNECAGNNAGVMCEQCVKGYTSFNSLTGTCQVCPAVEVTIIYFVGSLVGYIVLAAMIVGFFQNTTDALYMSHSVTLRIFVDYLHLASAVFLASEFAVDIEGTTLGLVLTALKAPVQTNLLQQCFLKEIGLAAYQTSTLLAIALVPVMLILNFIGAVLLSAISRCLHLRPEHHEEEEHPASSKRKGSLGSEDDPDAALAPTMMTKVMSNKVLRKTRGIARAWTREEEQLLFAKGSSLFWTRVTAPWKYLVKHFVKVDAGSKILRSSIIWVYILLPATIQLLLEPLACVALDDYRLKIDLNVVCNDSEHKPWFQAASVLLVFYGLGLPLLLVWKLSSMQSLLHHQKTRLAYGCLYIGFKQKVYYFEAVHMLRMGLVYTLAALPNALVRNLGLMIVIFLFIILHAAVRPFDNREFYVLERMQLLGLVAILSPACSTLMNHGEAMENTNQPWLKDLMWRLSFFAVVLLNMSVIIVFIKIMFRNLILKRWIMLNEIGRLGPLRRRLLYLLQGMRLPYVILNERTGFLHCEGLTARERKFLVNTLQNTLDVYMDVFAKKVQQIKNDDGHALLDEEAVFMPILLAVAIKQACKLSIQQRQDKERRLVASHSCLWHCLARCGLVSTDLPKFSRDSSVPMSPSARAKLRPSNTNTNFAELCNVEIPMESGEVDIGLRVTVEDLQVALLNLEPTIRDGVGKMHHLPRMNARKHLPIEVKDIEVLQTEVSHANLQTANVEVSFDADDVQWWPGDDASPREGGSPTSMPSAPSSGSWGLAGAKSAIVRSAGTSTAAVTHMEEQWSRARYWTQPSMAANVVYLKLATGYDGTRDPHSPESLAEELLYWKQQEHAARKKLAAVKRAMRSKDRRASGTSAEGGTTKSKLNKAVPAADVSFEEATKATALAREYILEEDMETTHAEYGQNDSMPSKSYTWWQSLTLMRGLAGSGPFAGSGGAASSSSPPVGQAGSGPCAGSGGAASSSSPPVGQVAELAGSSPPPVFSGQTATVPSGQGPQANATQQQAHAAAGVFGDFSMFNGMFGASKDARLDASADASPPQSAVHTEPPSSHWLGLSTADNTTFPIQKRQEKPGAADLEATVTATPSNPAIAQGSGESGWGQGLSMFKLFTS